MARPLRVQFSGALHYVTPRGNKRKPIFRNERDRPAQVRKYLSQCLSADAPARSAWRSRLSSPGARKKNPRGRGRPSPPVQLALEPATRLWHTATGHDIHARRGSNARLRGF
jgi:hypothetical protein